MKAILIGLLAVPSAASAAPQLPGFTDPNGPPEPTTYDLDDSDGPVRYMLDVSSQLTAWIPPQSFTGNVPEFFPQMASQFWSASHSTASFANTVRDGALEPGSPVAILTSVADQFDALGMGFDLIAADMADGIPDEADGFDLCGSALRDLAHTLPLYAPKFSRSYLPLLATAARFDTLAAVGTPRMTDEQGIDLVNHLIALPFDFEAVGHSLLPPTDTTPIGVAAATAPCPESHPFKGTTTYRRTKFVSANCQGWVRTFGGLSIGGAGVLPDAGIWVRNCWWLTETTMTEVSVCYSSRTKRFFAVGGVNKVVTKSPYPASGTEVRAQRTGSLSGPPPSAPPSPPADRVEVL